MNIAKEIIDSWNIYIKNIIIMIPAFLVALILGSLIAPLVGFMMMFVKTKRGRPIAFNDIFIPLNNFGKLLLGGVWIGILLAAAFIPMSICFYLRWEEIAILLASVAIIWDIYIGVSWVFALLMIYDKGFSINAGMKASKVLVAKNGWWKHFLLIILAGLISGLGSVAWGIGTILTIPLSNSIPLISLIISLLLLPVSCGAIGCAFAEETK